MSAKRFDWVLAGQSAIALLFIAFFFAKTFWLMPKTNRLCKELYGLSAHAWRGIGWCKLDDGRVKLLGRKLLD